MRKNFSAFLAYLRFALTFSSTCARALQQLGTTVDPFVYYLELQEGPNKNRFVHDIRLLIR